MTDFIKMGFFTTVEPTAEPNRLAMPSLIAAPDINVTRKIKANYFISSHNFTMGSLKSKVSFELHDAF